ncbi:hypothetical protein M2426_001272 [Pseudomonas moraviensis]|uniref:hypothetical protein n=1 Tax=Pseudomonas moraviensis TaxID=321662 RepID=UPI003D19C55E
MDAITSYLQPGRLADVLVLIQVLAYDRESYRSEGGLDDELQRKPTAGNTWMALAKQHPEFFRVRDDQTRKPRVALVARYVLANHQLPDGEEKRPPLDTSVANKLMELAIQLHDKQLERKNHWKAVVLPMAVAVIAASASIAGAIISSSKIPPPAVLQLQVPVNHSTAISPDVRNNAE